MKTRTGGFPLGFRRGGNEWEKDLSAVIAWCKTNGNYGDLWSEWNKRFPTSPLPKVPATLRIHSRARSEPPSPYSPESPSEPLTLIFPTQELPSGTT